MSKIPLAGRLLSLLLLLLLALGGTALTPRAQTDPHAGDPKYKRRCSEAIDRRAGEPPPTAQARCGSNARFGLPDVAAVGRAAAVSPWMRVQIAKTVEVREAERAERRARRAATQGQ